MNLPPSMVRDPSLTLRDLAADPRSYGSAVHGGSKPLGTSWVRRHNTVNRRAGRWGCRWCGGGALMVVGFVVNAAT